MPGPLLTFEGGAAAQFCACAPPDSDGDVGDVYAYRDSYGNIHANSNSNRYGYSYSNGHCYGDCHGHCNRTAAAYTDATASADTAASPLALLPN